MVEEVKKILSMDISEVIASEVSLTLLKCTSALYLNGSQPRTCARSQELYYGLLRKNGIELAKHYDIMMKKTHECVIKNANGYASGYGFIVYDNLTDEQAVDLLNRKILSESAFIKLPCCYLEAKNAKAEKIEEVETIDAVEAIEVEQSTDSFTKEEPAQREKRKYNSKNKRR